MEGLLGPPGPAGPSPLSPAGSSLGLGLGMWQFSPGPGLWQRRLGPENDQLPGRSLGRLQGPRSAQTGFGLGRHLDTLWRQLQSSVP